MIQKIDQHHADRTDFRAIGRVISPWGRRIGALRFETDGAWKRRSGGKYWKTGPIPSGTNFGLSVRVASLFTVALVLQ